MNPKEIFFDLLDKMNLTDKYPQKLSLRDAMTIRQETLGTVHTTDQLYSSVTLPCFTEDDDV